MFVLILTMIRLRKKDALGSVLAAKFEENTAFTTHLARKALLSLFADWANKARIKRTRCIRQS